MRAIQVKQTGGAEVLQLADVPKPKPGFGEVLVHVISAGVNFIDVYQREGRYPMELPFVPGQEGAGVVADAGAGVNDFLEGDRVVWANAPGSYAEFVIVKAEQLVKLPDAVRIDDAAALMVQGLTAHYLATSTYKIQSGDTVLVHAGAGGVGLLLTQMAKMRGARVIATVSSAAKAELAKEAGADLVVNYTTESFVEKVKDATGGEGLPVVYDAVGKTTFEDSLKCLRARGLMVLYGAASGAVPAFDPLLLMKLGSLYLTRPTMKDYLATRTERERRLGDIFGWVASGALKVKIGHRFKLEDAAEAHRDLEARKTVGKILLTV